MYDSTLQSLKSLDKPSMSSMLNQSLTFKAPEATALGQCLYRSKIISKCSLSILNSAFFHSYLFTVCYHLCEQRRMAALNLDHWPVVGDQLESMTMSVIIHQEDVEVFRQKILKAIPMLSALLDIGQILVTSIWARWISKIPPFMKWTLI